jgi:hypothetical protein
MEKGSDRLAVSEQTCAGEKPVPVVNVAAHERQSLGLGIRQIACCVHEALSEPDATESRSYRLPASEEVCTTRSWEEELPDRTAEHLKRLTEKREEEVAGFVKREVDPINEVVFVGEDKPADIGDQCYDQKTLPEHRWSIGEAGYEP